jgi:peptidyl-prolyl cis-trans isomerase D
MISWMQKHRKYLVVTIWISVIAFVGAGFVGWGTYQYGTQTNNIAKVGDIPVTVQEFQTAYGNLYQQYNRMMGGKLNEATAKQLGLEKQVLQSLIYQALLKNFAKEHGIVVSDKEVQETILSIPEFQKNGQFDKSIYLNVLKGLQLKPKAFEEHLRNQILLNKTLALLNLDIAPLELEAFGAAIFMADKLRYKVFRIDDIDVKISDDEIRSYWEAHKNEYMTPKRYKLALIWIEPSQSIPDEQTIETYYKEHRLDFKDSEGKVLPLKVARSKVIEELRLKAAKKEAQRRYIALKKGKVKAVEEILVDAGDSRFPANVWEAIEGALPNSVLKPKVVGKRYAIIKVIESTLPHPKSFSEAYNEAKSDALVEKQRNLLRQKAEKMVEHLENAPLSNYVTRNSIDKIPPLNQDEAATFLQQLFDTNQSKGAILLTDKAISYRIIDQKLLNKESLTDEKELIKDNTKKMKANLLQKHLLDQLQQQYAVEIYLKETE